MSGWDYRKILPPSLGHKELPYLNPAEDFGPTSSPLPSRRRWMREYVDVPPVLMITYYDDKFNVELMTHLEGT